MAVAHALETCYPGAQDERRGAVGRNTITRGRCSEYDFICDTRRRARDASLPRTPKRVNFCGLRSNSWRNKNRAAKHTRGLDIAVDYFYVSWARGATEADLQQLRELTQRARALANGTDGTKADHVRVMRLAGELGNALFARNEIPEALECFQEILTAAESETYDALAIANAAITTAGALMVQGHFNQAEPLARRGYEVGKTMPVYWFWFGGLAFANASRARARRPRIRRLAEINAAMERAETTANSPAAAGLAITLTLIHHMSHDWHAVLEAGQDAYARATNSNDSIYQDLALAFCAHASAELGEMERARALLERAPPDWNERGATFFCRLDDCYGRRNAFQFGRYARRGGKYQTN